MKANELLALRTLPDEYVADGTELCSVCGWVVVVNGQLPLPPIKWRKESGWTKLEFCATEAPEFYREAEPIAPSLTHSTLHICGLLIGCEPKDLPEPIATELVAFLLRYQNQNERNHREWSAFADRINVISLNTGEKKP